MKQIAFKGANRNTGFSPIQAGTAQLDQMRNRDSQGIRDLQESQNQKNKINSDRINDLENKYAKEAANRNELKSLEDKTFAVREQAIAQNQQQSAANARTEQVNAREGLKTWEALGNFSESIAKQVTQFQDDKNQADMEEAYAQALAEGLPANQVLAQERMEQELRAMGQTEEAIADEMARRGVNPSVVNQVRSGNKWRDYGRLKAYSEMAGDGYGPWLQEQLNKLGPEAAGPMKRAGAIQKLQQQYLKDNGLFGLSADFLGPMFSKMRTSSNGVMEAARKRQVVEGSTQMFEEARTSLYTQKSPEALNELFRAKSVGYGADGKTINGQSEGVTAVFTELKSTNRYSDAEVSSLLNNTITDNGQSFAERYPGKTNDLLYDRRESIVKDRALVDKEEKVAGEAKVEEVIEYFRSQPEGIDVKALDKAINELKVEGVSVSRLEALRYQTQQNIDKRAVTADIEEKWLSGTLTREDLDDVTVPTDIRNKYLDRVNKLDAAKAATGQSPATLKATLKSTLKTTLLDKGWQDGAAADGTLDLALDSAMSEYNRNFKAYSEVMSAEKAHDKAWNEIYEKVLNPKKGSTYYAEEDKENTNMPRYFPAFRPSATGPMMDQATFRAAIKEDPDLFKQQDVISKADANDGLRRAQGNRIPQIPPVLINAAKTSPYTATELYEQQIEKLTGQKVKFPRSAADTLSDQINDPKLQEILNRPTLQNISTSILSSEAAQGYSAPTTEGQALISKAAQEGLPIADLAAARPDLGITKTSYVPTRDPNNMSPTLQHFYTTGGETNGGWSEHTDFKQMDNPNTVEDEWGQYWEPDELDNYVGFTDPDYGDITLSELRKRIPIPGGNFGDPRSYGPHAGWDYGTKAGTKLYLKNGARKVSTTRVPGNGWRSVFKLPDGRYFAALHGKGV